MRKKITLIIAILLVTAVAAATAYAVYIGTMKESVPYILANGEEACEIADRSAYDEITAELSKFESETGITGSNSLSFEYVTVRKSNPKSVDEALDILCEMLYSGYSRGYAVECNGSRLAVCMSYSDAETAIEELKAHAKSEISVIIGNGSVSITDDFEIKSTICQKSSVLSLDEIRADIIGISNEDENAYGFIGNTAIYGDTSSDTYYSAVNSFGISRGSTSSAESVTYGNTGENVSYSTVVTRVYTEVTDFDIEYVDSKKLYVGETKVSVAGENGLVEKTVEITTNTDGSTSVNVISERVIAEPKTQTELRGIKTYPSTKPTGSFMWPIQDWFSISSYFGVKRGNLDGASGHYGIDLALSSGHNIYAADGGTVIWAGEKGTYGNLVIIQHEDSVQTYYGHMSEIKVTTGDYIYKGQVIGLVGMTGQATGPHLHFEVRINGKPVDPLKYLP